MMPLFDITEGELAGELLVNTPFSWPLERSRAAVEEMAYLLGWGSLSPASVWHALTELNKLIYGDGTPKISQPKQHPT
jgi:hypothetical protein